MVTYNIRRLYELALKEGEGLGSAYEYFVKLRLIRELLRKQNIRNVLIYGLPEKYGYSMDFFDYFFKKNIKISLFEKRHYKVKKLKEILKELNYETFIQKIRLIKKINQKFDLILSCEVVQALKKKELKEYVQNIENNSRNTLIFVPNRNNKAHNVISNLRGFSLAELRKMFKNVKKTGYVVMPPFPPGIKKKKKIKNRLFLNLLGAYAFFEEILPRVFKKNTAHICFVLINNY